MESMKFQVTIEANVKVKGLKEEKQVEIQAVNGGGVED